MYADLDGGQAQSQVIRQAGVTMRVEAVDLAASINDLNASVKSLVDRIRISALEATY